MNSVDLSFDGTLASFFYEQLEQARDGEHDPLGDEVEAYVVNLLAAHARRSNVAGRTTPPLAIQFLAAREHGPTALREVGDRALYIAGVVPRSLDRTPVSVAYVSGIGEAAYREIHVRKSRRVPENSSLDVFARLADRFREVVDLLGRIANKGQTTDLLALYERWRRDLDPRDARRLLSAGVLLDPQTADILQ
jgi:hypothetical protein